MSVTFFSFIHFNMQETEEKKKRFEGNHEYKYNEGREIVIERVVTLRKFNES